MARGRWPGVPRHKWISPLALTRSERLRVLAGAGWSSAAGIVLLSLILMVLAMFPLVLPRLHPTPLTLVPVHQPPVTARPSLPPGGARPLPGSSAPAPTGTGGPGISRSAGGTGGSTGGSGPGGGGGGGGHSSPPGSSPGPSPSPDPTPEPSPVPTPTRLPLPPPVRISISIPLRIPVRLSVSASLPALPPLMIIAGLQDPLPASCTLAPLASAAQEKCLDLSRR